MSATSLVTVEEVVDRPTLGRFVDLPTMLHHRERCFSPPLRAFERWRLDPARNPFFDRGDAAYFLARRGGQVAGRITAQVADPHQHDGAFGFFACVDDARVAGALVEIASGWLVDHGVHTMRGPHGFTAEVESGVRTAGFDQPARTALPWHPPWYAACLRDAGLHAVETVDWWPVTVLPGTAPEAADRASPPQAGKHADPRLVLADAAAVPDVAGPLGRSGLRGAWRLARAARRGDWAEAVAVELGPCPEEALTRLRSAAGAAGYERLWTSWVPEPADPPALTYTIFGKTLA